MLKILTACNLFVAGFLAGAVAGPISWHNYCFPRACPKIEPASVKNSIVFSMVATYPVVTIKSNGQVYFGRRYNRDREARALADAARRYLYEQPWPTCIDTALHPPRDGIVPRYFYPAPPIKLPYPEKRT